MPAIDSYFRSDIGRKRDKNQDAAGAHEPQDECQLKHSGRLYVVADGLGGHQIGEQASAFAVATLLEAYYKAPETPPAERLRGIIQKINNDLVAFTRDNLGPGEKTATTIVAAVVREGALLVAHVGDSRAYLLRNGEAIQVTRDHSFVGEMVRAGTITEAEARESRYRNRLTRSVGSQPDVEVDVSSPIRLQPGDVILLCTDGLTQYASAQDLLAAASGVGPRKLVERLIQFANARGGSDNITVSVIKYGRPFILSSKKILKTAAAIALATLMLAALSLLGWSWYKNMASPQATVTPTSLPTLAATLAPSLTPEPAPTASPIPIDTLNPSPTSLTEAPVNPLVLVDCEYTVMPDDIAGTIAEKFDALLEQIFRQDGTQENLDQISPGEILVIKGITAEACVAGGGVVPTPAPVTP